MNQRHDQTHLVCHVCSEARGLLSSTRLGLLRRQKRLPIAARDYVLSFASSSAYAVATPVFGVLPPRGVAHPPASMNSRCFHDSTFWNSASFAAALVCSMNRATQDGVRAVITAELARSAAIRSAVLPRVHPSDEKPTIIVATTPTIAPQTAGLNHGTCSCMGHLRPEFFALREVADRITFLQNAQRVR